MISRTEGPRPGQGDRLLPPGARGPLSVPAQVGSSGEVRPVESERGSLETRA